MSLDQTVSLTIDGFDKPLRVVHVRVRERLHSPTIVDVLCAVHDDGALATLDAADALTQQAKVSIATGGDPRVFEGVIVDVEEVDGGYQVRLAPKIALLDEAVDYQLFKDLDAVAIAEQVLGEHGITVEKRVSRTLAKRPQCVQAFESDLAFVSRILADEGVVWHAAHGSRDQVRFCDHRSAFDDVEGLDPLRVVEGAGLVAAASVHRARLTRSATTGRVILRDYDFTAPKRDLTREAGSGNIAAYEYPGGYTEASVGEDLAKIRLEEAQRRQLTLTGEASSPRIEAGAVITLTDAPRDDMNGRWLVVEVEHEGHDQSSQQQERYVARFTAVPADKGYRAKRTRAPSLGGVQTAVVAGPSGAEIHPDEFARVKALHRWDRRRKQDDQSSAFLRTMQPPTSGGFFLPRVGWEVVLGHRTPSGDQPFELGRLDTGQARPFASLPGNQVVSSFGSATTPGGGGGSHVALNDTAGNEGMAFHASRDFNEKTENDKVTGVSASETLTVGSNRTLIVGKVFRESVTGAQSHTISSNRTVNVGANMSINSASETVSVGGLRAFKIGGDYQTGCASLTRLVGAAKTEAAIESVGRSVTGVSTVLVGGAWEANAGLEANINVLGANAEEVGALKSIIAGKDYILKVTGALTSTFASQSITGDGGVGEDYLLEASYKAGGSMKVKGGDIVFQAKNKITISASGITVTITSDTVKIDGQFKGSPNSSEQGSGSYD
jgi:type VI secretion system secreted protein VgrG